MAQTETELKVPGLLTIMLCVVIVTTMFVIRRFNDMRVHPAAVCDAAHAGDKDRDTNMNLYVCTEIKNSAETEYRFVRSECR